ncbi:sugar phosphate isomerase/epimerase family protein [Furfurilactobacillus cerevisiae]|uniref:sugar phosphate isomerase/epimerase family protein n=1 Tax=Furfurilactobacillus rossiae TaxID=231049 RepID=UPI003B97EA54
MAYIINTLVYAERHDKGESQSEFLEDIKKLGADGVEARLEYFSDIEYEAPIFVEKAKKLGLKINLSVPDELFVDGEVNSKLDTYFKYGKLLELDKIKFNTGDFTHFNGDLAHILDALPEGIEFNVENDQTELSGRSQHILTFLQSAKEAGLNVGYVYDIGNWLVTGEDPDFVAKKMAPYTRYIHLKNMTGVGNNTSATLDEGKINWRTPAAYFKKGTDVALEYPMSQFERRSSELAEIKNVYK